MVSAIYAEISIASQEAYARVQRATQDTPVPVLAKGETDIARAWVYVCDDAPFGGPDQPAAVFRYSRDRSGDHPVKHHSGGIFCKRVVIDNLSILHPITD